MLLEKTAPSTMSGFIGGTDSRGDWVIRPEEDVSAVDHSELGVRRDRWRWARGAGDMVLWTEDQNAVSAEAKAHVEDFLKRKVGAYIGRHRGISSYNTWSDMIRLKIVDSQEAKQASEYRALLSAIAQHYDARIGKEVPRDYFAKIAKRLDDLRGLSPEQNKQVQALIDFAEAAPYYPADFREMLRQALKAGEVVEAQLVEMKAWVAPNGDIVKVDSHSAWEYKGREYRYGVDYTGGWVRVTSEGNDLLVPGSGLSNAQLRALKDYAIEHGYTLVDSDAANQGRSRRMIEAAGVPLYAAMNGWLGKSGEWVPYRHYNDAHELVARDWLTAQGTPVLVPKPQANYDARPGFAEMWRRGFLRVALKGNDTLMAHGPDAPTARQLAELKNRAMESGCSRLILDNNNSYRVLWDRSNAVDEALKIRVPLFAQAAFFQDHGAPEEFWAMRSKPKTRAGEMIEFYFGAKPVAKAMVSRVEEPGKSACGHSGKFGNKWKVHWQDASFRKLGEALEADDDTPVVGTVTLDGDVRFKQTWQSHSEAGLGRGHGWRYAPSTLRVYWWDNDDRTPEREGAVADALEADGFKVVGHSEMLPHESDEEMKGWHAAHATHARGRAKAVIEADEQNPYQGHDAPSKGEGGGSPLHNVVGAYPPDVYSSVGERYYSSGHRLDSQGYALIQSYKNFPNRFITVYRAVPKDVKAGINPGDWVTPIRAYATEHGRDNLRNEFRIVSKLVHARDLFTSGNSWLEWGYDPQPRDEENDRLRRERIRARYAAKAAETAAPEVTS